MTKVILGKFWKPDLAVIERFKMRTLLEYRKMESENKAQIKLLGVGSVRDRALKANLLAALESLKAEVDVQEIRNVKEFLNYGITGIPALLVGDKVVSQNIVPSVEELSEILSKIL